MQIRKAINVAVAIATLTVCGFATSQTLASGVIQDLYIAPATYYPGVTVTLKPATASYPSPAACVGADHKLPNAPTFSFQLSPDSPPTPSAAARAMFSALLVAQATGAVVTFTVSGACNVYGYREELLQVQITSP